MKTSLFDYHLPESLIATRPASPRGSARLLAVGEEGPFDTTVADLPRFLQSGDVMVFNDSRVIPARLIGKRDFVTVEILLHKSLGDSLWQCFAKPAKRLKVGQTVTFGDDFSARVIDKHDDGQVVMDFNVIDVLLSHMLGEYGQIPLPPYIEKIRASDKADRIDYQTVYATYEGSVAAPTAGLHFTERLLKEIDAMGVKRVCVTLHVGGGTFLPVKESDTDNHKMHAEWVNLSPDVARTINTARQRGGRIIAVGTTSLRVLETATDNEGIVHPFTGETDIFITPGYIFKAVELLLTNFHLPRSTLFMLVSAFAGMERVKKAYQHAIKNKYRFYSYGDACLLFRENA